VDNQLGCQHCGVVLHRLDARAQTRDGRLLWACPECGEPMEVMGVREALDLAREREEAIGWRSTCEGRVAGRAHR
jgi:uncharacterized C2H2 Zn-finger protein